MMIELIHTAYDYHYQRFREIWESIMTLSEARFFEAVSYSTGSLCNHMVHLIDDDLSWISLLEGKNNSDRLRPEDFATRAAVRERYDEAEAHVLAYVHGLDETALTAEFIWHPPFTAKPQTVTCGQVLWHVVNHGTDHRAQILRVLHDFGAPSFDQDLMGYLVRSGLTDK